MPVSEPLSPARLTSLDALRGLAALSVFVHHCLKLLTSNAYVASFDFGEFGVVLFFLISGYVITLSVERMGLAQFWIRRLFRLYPAYWLSIALALVLAWLVPTSVFAFHYHSLPSRIAVLNLTMLHRLLGAPYDLVPVYWTLFIEMLFYFSVTILVLLRRFTYSVPLAIGAIVLAIIVERLQRPGGYEPMRTTMYLAVMLTGTVFYRFSTGAVSRRALLGVSGMCLVMFVLIPTVPAVLTARLLALPLLAQALSGRRRPQPLVFLGQISYSFYLIHEIVMGSIDTGIALLNSGLWLAISLLVAYIIYRSVEYPTIGLARSLTKPCPAAPAR